MKKYVLFALLALLCACARDKNGTEAESGTKATVPEYLKKQAGQLKKVVRADQIKFVKDFSYDKYTLADVYPYRDTVRRFQWNKIRNGLVTISNAQLEAATWGILRNRGNVNGEAPLAVSWVRNAYGRVSDTLGVERYQSVPLYAAGDTITPVRYGNDGSLAIILGSEGSFVKLKHVYYGSEWYVPKRYVKEIPFVSFDRVAAVDRTNQNIATLERTDTAWLVRSMNPATTGLHNPPFQMETPTGIFVVQEKKPKMIFLKDGTTQTGGFAPWASRFSNGGYIHGVPVNLPASGEIEYSYTLGTTPRSHMCVRNATSHAKFVYDWAVVNSSLVFVFD